MSSWAVHEPVGPASVHHQRVLGEPVRRSLWVLPVERPTLVIGSTQPDDIVDHEAVADAGVDVVRRRSGGGAVLLEPEHVTAWIDVEIPTADRLWVADVRRAAVVVGEVWSRALASLGVDAAVHTGGFDRSAIGRLVCFADVAPGEVTTAGRKLVGLAQRRTAAGARFQTVVLRRWRPAALLALLVADEESPLDAGPDLADRATGLDLPTDDVVQAVIDHLPA